MPKRNILESQISFHKRFLTSLKLMILLLVSQIENHSNDVIRPITRIKYQCKHGTIRPSIDNHTQSMIKHTFYPQELCTKVPHSLPYWTRPPKTQHMGHESLVLETPHCYQPRDTRSHPTKSDHGRIGPAPLTNQNRFSTTNENRGFSTNQVTGFRTN